MIKPRFSIEGVTSALDVLLADGAVLRALPAGEDALEPGKGPGDLEWRTTVDSGVPGLRAVWQSGAFVILRVTSSKCALFHEHAPGEFTALAIGPPSILKNHAMVRCTPPCPEPPSTFTMSTQAAAVFARYWRGRRGQ